MKKLVLVLALSGIFASCKEKQYYQVEIENPKYKANTLFSAFEKIALPRFDSLRTFYHLDTVVKDEKDELKRILLLRHWIREVIRNDDHQRRYSGKGHPAKILDAALKGEGFHCAHYMAVQNGIYNAFGYVTRCLGAGPGVQGAKDGHHGINEVWINSLNKWVLIDAKYDHHFEKNGTPLSGLEVRDEYLKNRARDIEMVKGPERRSFEVDPVTGRDKASHAQTYTWIQWLTTEWFTIWPQGNADVLVYQDDYFKNNTWIWDGKPHWAYGTEYMKFTDSREAIEWTPNTIRSEVEIMGSIAKIKLVSDTPNFKEYLMKEAGKSEWKKIEDITEVKLKNDRHEWTFVAVNAAGVKGPEHKIVIKSENNK